ncbi:hypothetical protein [Methylomonas fluvii]|nr:hypothetical protein [Methylomonas fluvii]
MNDVLQGLRLRQRVLDWFAESKSKASRFANQTASTQAKISR